MSFLGQFLAGGFVIRLRTEDPLKKKNHGVLHPAGDYPIDVDESNSTFICLWLTNSEYMAGPFSGRLALSFKIVHGGAASLFAHNDSTPSS